MENEKKYQENTKHYHLTQQPDYKNIKNRDRNIQGIQQYLFDYKISKNRFRIIQEIHWYWFIWFLLCVGKVADKKRLFHGWRGEILSGECGSSLFNSVLKFKGYWKQIQKCTRNKMMLVHMVCVMNKKSIGRIMFAICIEKVQCYWVYTDHHYLT